MTTALLKVLAVALATGMAGVLVASAEGCTVLVNDQPPDDASTGVSSCEECQYQACIAQWAVCGNAAECMAIYTCATAPGCEQSCVDQCYLAHQAGQAKYYALASCDSNAKQSATCVAACTTPDASAETSAPDTGNDSGDDGGNAEAGDGGAEAQALDSGDDASADSSTGDATPADASAPDASSVLSCTDCSAQKCMTQQAACGPGSACDRYTGCIGGCTTTACVTQCGTDNPQGQAASSALGDCVTQQCSKECGLSQ